jgi:hypothetical protein
LGNSEDSTYKTLLLKVLQDFAGFLKKVGYDVNSETFLKNQEIVNFPDLERVKEQDKVKFL